MAADVDLSIIITAHNEGLTAHKTMLSLFEATKKLTADNVTFEVIISVDSGNNSTLEYFNRYMGLEHFHILQVNFHDLSTSRNNAVKQSLGSYITFLDADDLISSNWLLDSILLLRSDTNDRVSHPEYSITFGDDDLLWRKRDSSDKTFDTLCLVDNNLWDSPCMAKRSVFLEHPYHKNGEGIGFEDKHFNCQTLADDIPHVIIPKTVLFVRRKLSGSMLRQASAELVTLAKTSLLSYEAIRNLDVSEYLSVTPTTKSRLSRNLSSRAIHTAKVLALKTHRRLKRYESYNSAIKPLREKQHARTQNRLDSIYPNWLVSSWKQAHLIDNTIFPSKELLKRIGWYNAENIQPGLAYARLIQSFREKPDTLFFVPHLIRGGADKLFINYSAELATIHPDWNIAVLQTEAKESVWLDKLSKNIDFINLFEKISELDVDTQYRLLATLTSQLAIKRIIIGNSQLAYDFISKHQSLMKKLDIAVYCFAFGEEFDDEGRLWGHIHTGIPRIYPVIHKIITDNENTVNKLEAEYAFSRTKFRVHYQPTTASIRARIHNTDHHPIRILWASRVCKQKRPDLLKAISNGIDPEMFVIDAYGQLEEGLTEDYFADSHVNYRGPFNGSDSLPTDGYDIFLYTSEGDGIPNILQEMTAAGLPIVASNVGGIREFIIMNETGLLVTDHEDIREYTTTITRLTDEGLRQRLNEGAQKLLRTRFSYEAWQAAIRKDFDR